MAAITTTFRQWLGDADNLLRGRGWGIESDDLRKRLVRLSILLMTFGGIYGAAMGMYYGDSGIRILQMLYSGIKVPILLLATFALSLPTFFVVNTLFGLRDDFGQCVRALLATQAGLTIILASLAPITLLWYASSDNYDWARLVNAIMFAIASLAAQQLLRRFYGPLIRKDKRHRTLLFAWIVIYSFVSVQMSWILRPFIGHPDLTPTFFRQDAWGNAYVELARVLMRAL